MLACDTNGSAIYLGEAADGRKISMLDGKMNFITIDFKSKLQKIWIYQKTKIEKGSVSTFWNNQVISPSITNFGNLFLESFENVTGVYAGIFSFGLSTNTMTVQYQAEAKMVDGPGISSSFNSPNALSYSLLPIPSLIVADHGFYSIRRIIMQNGEKRFGIAKSFLFPMFNTQIFCYTNLLKNIKIKK